MDCASPGKESLALERFKLFLEAFQGSCRGDNERGPTPRVLGSASKKAEKTRAGDFIATPSRSSGDQMRALIKSSAGPVTKLTFQRACAGRWAKPHAVIWRGYEGDRTHARAGAWPHQLRRPRVLAL